MGIPLIPQARAREARVPGVVSAGAFLFFNSYGSINVAIPGIQAEFGSSLSAVQWIATTGLVLSSSLALCLGRAGDILGRSRLYQAGGMLSACGPGAGALGIGLAVSLMEGTVAAGAGAFVAAQRMAMLTLLPLPLVALGLAVVARFRIEGKAG